MAATRPGCQRQARIARSWKKAAEQGPTQYRTQGDEADRRSGSRFAERWDKQRNQVAPGDPGEVIWVFRPIIPSGIPVPGPAPLIVELPVIGLLTPDPSTASRVRALVSLAVVASATSAVWYVG